jgi:hypothetical protein
MNEAGGQSLPQPLLPQLLLQEQPQLQEPPVAQAQPAPQQPQPQGQEGAGVWIGLEGRDEQEQVMGWLRKWDGTGRATLRVAHLLPWCSLP